MKFDSQIKNLLSEIEITTKELKFDRNISSKTELFIHTNTKFFRTNFSNQFNNLLNSLSDSEKKELLLKHISLKYKLEQQQGDMFLPIEFADWENFINEINKIDAEDYL